LDFRELSFAKANFDRYFRDSAPIVPWPYDRSTTAGSAVPLSLAHVLVGEPATTPDQVGGRLSPEHALSTAAVSHRHKIEIRINYL